MARTRIMAPTRTTPRVRIIANTSPGIMMGRDIILSNPVTLMENPNTIGRADTGPGTGARAVTLYKMASANRTEAIKPATAATVWMWG
jgi:hypothetical protein